MEENNMEDRIPYMDEYTEPGPPSRVYSTADDIVDIAVNYKPGDPVVLFVSHPSDHESLLVPHVQELAAMKQRFIVIWHFHDGVWNQPVDMEGDIYLWLADTDAVIIPVTSEFMDQPNYARDLVLTAAMETDTPILAILCEETLEERFRTAYPKVPYIFDRGIRQDGGIPYQALLTMFVNECRKWNMEEGKKY